MTRRPTAPASTALPGPPRRARSALVLLLGAGVVCGGAAAWPPAAGPAAVQVPQPTELGLSARADLAVAVSVRRLLPEVISALAARQVAGRFAAELSAAATDDDEALLAALKDDPSPRFTTESGTSQAGEVVLRWLDDARHHGLDGLTAVHADLAARAASIEARAAQSPAPTFDVDVAAQELADAWAATSGDTRQRLRATGDALSDSHPEVQAAASQQAAELLRRVSEQAALELGLARAALRLAVELAPRPRRVGVLDDEDGVYLSPDTMWQAPEPVSAEERLAQVAAVIEAAGNGPDELARLFAQRTPKVGDYAALVEASRRYEAICTSGGWAHLRVPAHIRQRAWTDTSRIRALQTRLAAEGWLEPELVTGVYDDATVLAMKGFQAAHHVKVTGSFNEHTASELNVPCADRLWTIRVNVKRWRHTARTPAVGTFVQVNLAAQEAVYVRDGELKSRNRTVVGSGRWFWSRKQERRVYPKKSPLLSDAISKVVVNPSWTIPSSIVIGEIRKRMEKDPDYLAKKGYQVRKSSSGYEQFVEPPSAHNTLGQVKLLFPNSESIYLHDTNQRGFFLNERRDLSHGCIRVHDALDFAAEILVDDFATVGTDFSPRKIHQQASNDQTYVYALAQEVPVYLEYYTASPDPDGSGMVRFHIDVYDYDLETLEGAPLDRRVRRQRRNG